MSPERELVVDIMKASGWTAEKLPKGKWRFRNADTDGWSVEVTRPNGGLTLSWAADMIINRGEDQFLALAIKLLKEQRLREKFPLQFQRHNL